MSVSTNVSVNGRAKEVSVNGRVVFWTLGEDSDHAILEQGLTDCSLGGYCPDENTAKAALKSALVSIYGSRRCLIRPLDGRAGYLVVQEKGEGEGNISLSHVPLFSVDVPTGPEGILFKDPESGEIVEHHQAGIVRDQFWRELDKVPSHKVARALVNIIDRISGTSLRETGGIYWIPERTLPIWEKVVTAVESASPSNAIYALNTAKDDDCLRAVVAGLTHSVSSEMDTIRGKIRSGKLGDKALATQNSRAADLRLKIQLYEKLFGKTLTELKDSTEDLESAEVMTALAQLAI